MKNNRRGIALIVTMLVMAILISVTYVAVSKMSARQRRHNYLINYTKARYACDSGTRWAQEEFQQRVTFELQSRAMLPDFSDVFAYDEEDYAVLQEQLAEAVEERKAERLDIFRTEGTFAPVDTDEDVTQLIDEIVDSLIGFSSAESVEDYENIALSAGGNLAIIEKLSTPLTPEEIEQLTIPGPYGFDWPQIIKPLEIELGEAVITVSIEDENAKYPLVWMLEDDSKTAAETEVSGLIFAEWMGLSETEQQRFFESAEKGRKIKPFTVGMDAGKVTKNEDFKTRSVVKDDDGKRKSVFTTRTRQMKVDRGENELYMDYMYLLRSVFDVQGLSRDYLESDGRQESSAKYLGLWGTQQVNVNTAPRHILEAMFCYGGDETKIADDIIRERMEKPFDTYQELRNRLYSYSISLDKCKERMLFRSSCWTIQVEAKCGNAVSRSTTAIMRSDRKFVKIATVYR